MAYQKISEAEEGSLAADRHTTMADIDSSPDSSSRSKVLKSLGLVVLATAGAAAVIRVSGAATPVMSLWYYDDDQYESTKPWASESYECKDYKDDDFYTADLCGEFDTVECFTGTYESGNPACNNSYWCNELCGDYCGMGAGAICFFEKLSDLKTTCSHVTSLKDQYGYDPDPQVNWEMLSAVKGFHDVSVPDAADDSLGPDINSANVVDDIDDFSAAQASPSGDDAAASPTATAVASGDEDDTSTTVVATDDATGDDAATVKHVKKTKTKNHHKKKKLNRTSYHEDTDHDDDLADVGCGRHTYCDDCKDYCREQKMKHWLESQYGARGGYSPRAAKMAIIDIVNTCEYFGFSTNVTTAMP